MRRTTLQYLDDILEASRRIERYVGDVTFSEFCADTMRMDAIIRNFEVIGEAVKNLPDDLKENNPDTDWRKIAGFRDVLSHAYFGINPTILWDNARNRLPLLEAGI
jgi:uncharacterized protein with HEPN domain